MSTNKFDQIEYFVLLIGALFLYFIFWKYNKKTVPDRTATDDKNFSGKLRNNGAELRAQPIEEVNNIKFSKNVLLGIGVIFIFAVVISFIIGGIDILYWYKNPLGGANKSAGYLLYDTYLAGKKPMGIATDGSGNVWVTNCGSNTVTRFNSSGVFIGTYKTGGCPVGIAIDASGNVWIANHKSDSVTKLSPSGTLLDIYPAGNAPYGLAIGSSGKIWIANQKNSTVTELTASGSVIANYQVMKLHPFSLKDLSYYFVFQRLRSYINGIVLDKNGNVWVTNQLNNTVSELSPTGTVLGTHFVNRWPDGLAIDSSGNIWIACDTSVNILIPSTSKLYGYSARYKTTGPTSIAIDASGNVWVSNISGNNVLELNPEGSLIKTYSIGGDHEGIAIDASGNVWVTNVNRGSVSIIHGAAKGPQYFPYKGPQFPGGGNF